MPPRDVGSDRQAARPSSSSTQSYTSPSGPEANRPSTGAQELDRTYRPSGQELNRQGEKDVQDHVKDVAGQIGQAAQRRIDQQRERAVQGLGGVAQALRRSTESMREEDNAQYVRWIADRVERFANYLRPMTVQQLSGEVERFARNQRGLFLGGAFLLGFLGARFLKSSSEGSDAERRAQTSMPRSTTLPPSGGRGAL